MDAQTILPVLFGAIGALFAALSAVQARSGAAKDRRIEQLEKDVEALEKENKGYLAVFVTMAVGNEESLSKGKRIVAKILRGEGYEID